MFDLQADLSFILLYVINFYFCCFIFVFFFRVVVPLLAFVGSHFRYVSFSQIIPSPHAHMYFACIQIWSHWDHSRSALFVWCSRDSFFFFEIKSFRFIHTNICQGLMHILRHENKIISTQTFNYVFHENIQLKSKRENLFQFIRHLMTEFDRNSKKWRCSVNARSA